MMDLLNWQHKGKCLKWVQAGKQLIIKESNLKIKFYKIKIAYNKAFLRLIF